MSQANAPAHRASGLIDPKLPEWPFTKRITVSTSNINADRASISGAIALMGTLGNGEILTDAETYDEGGEIEIFDPMEISGAGMDQTIVTRSGSITNAILLGADGVTMRDMTIANTGDGVGNSNCVLNQAYTNLTFERVLFEKVSGNPTNGIGLNLATGSVLALNCKWNVTSGSVSKYAIYLSGDATLVVEGGEITAGAIVTGHASAVVVLRGPKLGSGVTIDTSGGGAVQGWYVDDTGNVVDLNRLTIGEYLVMAQGVLTLTNGLNSDITLGNIGVALISGPTTAFSVGGFTGGVNGRILLLLNTTAQNMTVVNQDASSTVTNRINTLTGGNLVSTGQSTVLFFYTQGRWFVLSFQA